MLISLTLLREYEWVGESGVSVKSGKVGDSGDSGSAKRSKEPFLPGEVMSRVTRGGVASRSSTTIAGMSARARVVSFRPRKIMKVAYLGLPFSAAVLHLALRSTAVDMISSATKTGHGQSQRDP